MDSDEESEDALSVNSEIEDSEEIYETPLLFRTAINRKRKYERKYKVEENDSSDFYVSSGSETDDEEVNCSNNETRDFDIAETRKSFSTARSYPLRSTRWSPKIESVSHFSREDASEQIKEEIGDLIEVDEDEIKLEKVYVNEDDDPLDCNDLRKSIFTEYPNLKINDEFKFTSCSIKLEKMDFSHLPLESSSPAISETNANTSQNTRRSRGRPPKKERSKRTSKANERVQLRSSNRLKRTASVDGTKEVSSQKRTRKSSKSKRRKRPNGNGPRPSVTRSDERDVEVSSLTKSKKVQFMEAHGLTDRQESISKSKSKSKPKANGNLKSPAKKKMSLADTNSRDSEAEEKTPTKKDKDHAAEYKKALAQYFAEIDTYKQELESYFECLCCDRKYATLEQCKVHVREHFPGVLTS